MPRRPLLLVLVIGLLAFACHTRPQEPGPAASSSPATPLEGIEMQQATFAAG